MSTSQLTLATGQGLKQLEERVTALAIELVTTQHLCNCLVASLVKLCPEGFDTVRTELQAVVQAYEGNDKPEEAVVRKRLEEQLRGLEQYKGLLLFAKEPASGPVQ